MKKYRLFYAAYPFNMETVIPEEETIEAENQSNRSTS